MKREPEAFALWKELAQLGRPSPDYGLVARARCVRRDRRPCPRCRRGRGAARGGPVNDPLVGRADELLAAGLDVEAGMELGRGEPALTARLGRDRALAILPDCYPAHAGVAPGATGWPRASDRRRRGRPARGRPPLLGGRLPARLRRSHREARAPRGAYPISSLLDLRRESGFLPTDVFLRRRARALADDSDHQRPRGGRAESWPSPEQLFMPEVNAGLGASYIGGLVKTSRRQRRARRPASRTTPRRPSMMRWCDQMGRGSSTIHRAGHLRAVARVHEARPRHLRALPVPPPRRPGSPRSRRRGAATTRAGRISSPLERRLNASAVSRPRSAA